MRARLRGPGLAAVLLSTGAASPYPPYAFVEPLMPPPAQKASSNWSGFAPAPMPDPDLDDPAGRAATSSGPALTPGFYRPSPSYLGDGFTPYSDVQREQKPQHHPAPALNLSVPLE
jgi:hypothetical protein